MSDPIGFPSAPPDPPIPAVRVWDLPPQADWEAVQARESRKSLAIAGLLFALTLISTLAVGAQFSAAYASGKTADLEGLYSSYPAFFAHPQLLLSGVPFAFTLISILLAHELGHFFACRYYGISATYPYFLPAPTLIGTLGAFILIRSPIPHRKALFDVGLAGPVVGFLFAIPALAIAILYSKAVPFAQTQSSIGFGQALAQWLLEALLRPGMPARNLLLHPVGRAAWVGLFVTALNLLPGGQLDGGHILYAATPKYHRKITFLVAALLAPLGYFFWQGWFLWAILLLVLGFRHPPVLDKWEPLDRKRLVWTGFAILIFVLCFMPAPVTIR